MFSNRNRRPSYHKFIQRAKELQYEVGLCLNVSTKLDKLEPYIEQLNYVQLMGVNQANKAFMNLNQVC